MSTVIQLFNEYASANASAPISVVLLIGALLWFGICGSILYVVDSREHRLPNRWTAMLFTGGAILLLASTVSAPDSSVLAGRWGMVLIGSGSYLVMMFILHLVTRAGLGMGDVKLAAGLGLYTGFLGVEALIAGFMLAFVVGGLQAVYLIIFRGAKKTTRIAFGPAMLIGCLLTMLI